MPTTGGLQPGSIVGVEGVLHLERVRLCLWRDADQSLLHEVLEGYGFEASVIPCDAAIDRTRQSRRNLALFRSACRDFMTLSLCTRPWGGAGLASSRSHS